MILGDTCTRHCGFCAVKAGNPGGVVDWTEPDRLARAAAALQLKHVVVTTVARDDLSDGGAAVYADCVRKLHQAMPEVVVEVLTSDFEGKTSSWDTMLESQPDIFNHNIETVERLTPRVRSKATYRRSLELLRYVKNRALTLRSPFGRLLPLPPSVGEGWGEGTMKIKSGLMLGLGETKEEILQTLTDLRAAGCDYLTIGQYLQPSAKHLSIQTFVPIEDFKHWEREAFRLGFERVASGPLVRSSYFADQLHVRPESRVPSPETQMEA